MNSIRVALVGWLALCVPASVAVGQELDKTVRIQNDFALGKDQLILVKEFDTDEAEVRGDKSGVEDRVEAKTARVPQLLAIQIVEEFTSRGYRVAPFSEDAAIDGVYVLDGILNVIDNGSGAARVWIGFGAGQAKLLGRIRVHAAGDSVSPLIEGYVQGTSKGRGGVFAGGSMEQKTIRTFASNTVDIVTGLNSREEPSELRRKADKNSAAAVESSQVKSESSAPERIAPELAPLSVPPTPDAIEPAVLNTEDAYAYVSWEYSADSLADYPVQVTIGQSRAQEVLTRGDKGIAKINLEPCDVTISRPDLKISNLPKWSPLKLELNPDRLSLTRIVVQTTDSKRTGELVVTVYKGDEAAERHSVRTK